MRTKNLFTIFAVILSLSFFECNTPSEEKALESGILKEHVDLSVNPGDDFISYVNGTWVKNTEIPADKSSYSVGHIVQEESEENVKKIIEESASGEFEKGTDEQKVGDLYQSFMDLETRNKLGVDPIREELNKVTSINSYDELASYFGYAIKSGINAPLGSWINPDFKNPTSYAAYTWQSGLGLPDREYYLKNDDRSKEIQTKYVKHIEKMFNLADLANGKAAAQTVMKVETSLAERHVEKEKARDWVSLYNKLSLDTLPLMMPNFNWEGFLDEAGFSDQKTLIVLMLDYTMSLDALIKNTNLDDWKTYLTWSVLDANASRLTEALDNQNFEFYDKELRGTQEQRPLWRRGVAIVNRTLGEVVGKVYVKKHFPPEAKVKMETLVSNLLKAYEVSIKELDWMSEDTKKAALDKLSKFRPKIGYPNIWKQYDIEIKPDDFYGNLRRSGLLEYNRELLKLGKPIDKEEWGLTPQTVNAYYNPTMNEIVFPAAILQPPFFNMNAEDAVNYGAIGAIIGHEIGHGFDDMGSTFDGDGAMRNWWTDEDREEFDKRTDKLVVQYDGYEALPGLNVNGEFTLGENIGDLGGLSISLKAYQISLEGIEAPVMDGYSGIQRVFLGYGQVWRGKSRAENIRVQVNSDPHSPREFRVNGVVRNVPEFYIAFNVQETDSLYLPPEERVKIW